MKLKPPANSNYAAVIVKIEKLVELENCANVQAALIFGNSVIVGKDVELGMIGVYFPVECQLSPHYLCLNNLYQHQELNYDRTKKGYFGDNGRVRSVKFRSHPSQGFFMPLSSLDLGGVLVEELSVGDEFDRLPNIKGVEFKICRKYVVKVSGSGHIANKTPKSQKKVKRLSRLVPDQFRLHSDTAQLFRNLHQLTPDTTISISEKLHGSSWVVGNVLVKKKLSWPDRLFKFFGANVVDQEYGLVWASRRVVKNKWLNDPKNGSGHFYGYDMWKDIAQEIGMCVEKGTTLYGEILGFTRDNGAIQKGYHYGCLPNQHKLSVYRITQTNADGKVFELPFSAMLAYCVKYGLTAVPLHYLGKAKDAFPEVVVNDQWHDNFLAALKSKYVADDMCGLNAMSVPREGVVVKLEDRFDDFIALKQKSHRFQMRETEMNDKGEVDIESQEAEPEEVQL